jgi:predicted dehydrogenase
VEQVPIPEASSGHGGGDAGIVRSFVRALRGQEPPLTPARESLESHLLAFAAEQSRLSGATVDMAAFRAAAG